MYHQYGPGMECCSGPDCDFTKNITKEHLLHHVRAGIPTKINCNQLDLLPSRTDFLDSNLKAAFAAQIRAKKPILFMPTTVDEKNDFIRDPRDPRSSTLQTHIYLIGALPDGSKALVILEDVEVYVDVMVPTSYTTRKDIDSFDDFLRGMMVSKKLAFAGISDVRQFRLKGFQKEKQLYKRVRFHNLGERKKLIDAIIEINKSISGGTGTAAAAGNNRLTEKIETAADDVGRSDYYFPKVARDHKFSTADWNRIENYEVVEAPELGIIDPQRRITNNCSYAFRVKLRDYQKLSKERRKDLMKQNNPLKDVIDKDPTLQMQWDIETYRTIQNGIVPEPEDKDYNIFMMNCAFFWQHSDEPLLTVCCQDVNAMIHPGAVTAGRMEKTSITIICGSETNVLTSYMEVVGRMSPEIIAAFNGSSFDWPLFREKLRREGLLIQLHSKFSSLPAITSGRWAITEESVLKWNFRPERIKIDAENTHQCKCVAVFPGILDTDVLPVFLKFYTRMEVRKAGSLNFFLAKNGLPSKEDMHYKRMFRIYERALKLMKVVSCHCGDAQKQCACCSEVVREIDCKPVASGGVSAELEYTTDLYDDLLVGPNDGGASDGPAPTPTPAPHTPMPHQKCCFCGKKPRNLRDMADVGFYCTVDCLRPQQLYVKRSVVADKRELSTMSCVSLYDSFYRADGMKVRNLIGKYSSKLEIAFSNAKSDKSEEDKDHYPGAWVFPPKRGLNAKRPITGLDFASLYPSLMMAYNLSPDMVVYSEAVANALAAEGYSIHHISPFSFERGAEKGRAGNQHLVKEGWTVRHNGIFNRKKDSKKVDEYCKFEKFSWVEKTPKLWHDNETVITDANGKPIMEEIPWVVKYPVSLTVKPGGSTNEVVRGITAAQKAQIDAARAAGYKVSRGFGYDAVRGRDAIPGERMGIFPFIVKKLFDKRVPIKAEFVRLSKLKEQMESAKVKEWKITHSDGSTSTITMKEVNFQINKVDAKQKALKVLANTFYGESGNYRSSIYELLVAAGITGAGQENIKRVAAFVTAKGFEVWYGDTDSLYLTCPDHYYADADAKYAVALSAITAKYEGVPFIADTSDKSAMSAHDEATQARIIEYKKERVTAKVKYWDEMVAITMVVMNNLKEEVSDYLMSNNGTCFLNMAYEEVGFPTVLCGKKKYYMTPHIEKINFYPKDIFIRGIDIIKQGQAVISKKLGMEFMTESLAPENERELIDLAEDKIRKLYRVYGSVMHGALTSGDDIVDPAPFVMSGRYKPNKKNIPVLSFVARLRDEQKKFLAEGNAVMAALYEPPEAGDKFDYVIVEKDQRYTLQGSRIELKKGDRMELLRVFKASQATPNPMKIDLSFYVKNMIIGIFARFIAYHDKFQPPANMYDLSDKEQYKKMDQHCIDEASKYLERICDSITGFDKTALTQQGRDYRKLYTSVNKSLHADLTRRYGPSGFLFSRIDIHEEDEQNPTYAQSTRIINQIRALVRENAKPNPVYGKEFVTRMQKLGIGVFLLRRLYVGGGKEAGISKHRAKLCDEREQKIVDALYKVIPRISRMLYVYERTFIRLIEDMRKVRTEDGFELNDGDLERLNMLSREDEEALQTTHKLFIELLSVMQLRQATLDIADAIESEKARQINDTSAGRDVIDPRMDSRTDAKEASIIDDYQWM